MLNHRKIREKLALIKRITNIKVVGNFIIGYPIETETDICRTIKFARELPLFAANFYNFYLVPGAPIYDEVINEEKNNNRVDWESMRQGRISYIPKGILPIKFIALFW